MMPRALLWWKQYALQSSISFLVLHHAPDERGAEGGSPLALVQIQFQPQALFTLDPSTDGKLFVTNAVMLI